MATATLTNTAAGTSAVTAMVNGSSQTVNITFAVVPALTGVSVNRKSFKLDEGFPTIGFTGAEFMLTVTGAATDYTWSSSATTWALVDSAGKVSFTEQGNASPVTITATPKSGETPLTYTFTVRNWFINNGETLMNHKNSSDWCINQGLIQPAQVELTQSQNIRQVGALWSEWGNLNIYNGSGFHSDSSHWSWTSTMVFGPQNFFAVSMQTGAYGYFDLDSLHYVVCRKSL